MKSMVQAAVLIVFSCLLLGLCGCEDVPVPDGSSIGSSMLEDTPSASTTTSVTTTTTTTTTVPSVEVVITLSENGFAYSQLDATQQENYDAIVQALYEKRGQETYVDGEPGLTITLPHCLTSEDDVMFLSSAVYDDHPEFFYLKAQTGWITINGQYPAVRLMYLWEADERAARAEELEENVSQWVDACAGMSDWEKICYFHDVLTQFNDYNEAAAEEVDSESPGELYYEASTPYAALCSGDPICGGYTRAFQLLLDRVGIENTALSNDDHAWTMVWLDGEAYHVDVTWDDSLGGEEDHDYLNVTDEEILRGRDYPEQQFDVPSATATAYNYHTANGWYFTDAYDETLGECVRSQIEAGKDEVELKFSSDAYEEACWYLFEDNGYFDIAYELEDDSLRDRWYGAILYEENDEMYTIKIYPDE